MENKFTKTSWEIIILIIIVLLLKGWWCNGEISENVGEMEKIEQENLYNAIQGFVGNWWNGPDLYPDPCGWTPIQGVSCDSVDGFWYVTELNIGPLHDNSLNLMILDISNAGLSGKIPTSMAKLKKLRYVGLDNNSLIGILPAELANMPSVNAIYVNGNNLTGILNFSSDFYKKLGKRFKAWNNPNLCYIGEVISSAHAPFGVQPCTSNDISDSPTDIVNGAGRLQEELVWVSFMEESVKLNSDYNSSFGLLRHGTDGVWLVFLVEFFMMMLLRNFFK